MKTEVDAKKALHKNEVLKRIIKEIVSDAIIFVICLFLVPHFVAEGVRVKGSSMENTLHNKDRLIVEKITTSIGTIERFDIIILDPHNQEDEYWIKRVIGLPGETIQIIGEDIFINGKILDESYGKDPLVYAGIAASPLKLADDEYFVLGDNRTISFDSRDVGAIKKSDIEGRAFFSIWPRKTFGTID